ncbi:hypothetical protein FJQ54_12000 [Sandaracinobacter neustonicus]|uniref:Uncharacterized protein n=1 Tax=Sandaracinobacter neustonicus TaxID=1715348 RepID=A0A501XHL2_9SPHN|nr:hypothetical protein [Sandaracinobacter neustonicus]TPE60128.1 hypothetical protein FJQ54_12000 [Sandaracinobacter neustonicus]
MASKRDPFFARMGWLMLAITLLAFPLTYFAPLAAGSRSFAPIIHIYGLAYFSWILLYAWQSQLVAWGKVARHRELGLAGIAISALMLPLGIAAAIHAALRREQRGVEQPWAFTLFNMVDLALFIAFVTAAIASVTRHPQWHRRFMYGAAVCLVGPAISRWFLWVPPMPHIMDSAPNLLADLLLIPLMLHDRRVLGRVHPATWWVIAIAVPLHIAAAWFYPGEWWNALAPSLLALRV